jgi:DNA primase
LSEKVVLALDADKAGINAMKKGADLMLRRGLDVKVAEMPMGKDPADIIQKDAADFKKVIGQSVHVIEFLLHVLRRENTDDRSYKLKAREEVLPFVLLLPSRIDQEHFITKVAKAIDSTTDAVRFELNRLRDEAEANPTREPDPYSHEPSEVKNSTGETSSAAADKAYVFLLACVQILDGKLAKKLKKEIDLLKKMAELEEPSKSTLAGVVFTLEQQFSDLLPRMVHDEVVAKLNQLKKLLIRKRLAAYKLILKQAEDEEDEKAFVKVLKDIQEYETKLREPEYAAEELFGKKD